MFLVTVKSVYTGETEQYMAKKLTFGENLVSFPRPGCKQVHIYNGMFDRDDSCIVIETDEPVRVIPFFEPEEKQNGY